VKTYGVKNINFCDLTAITKRQWTLDFCDAFERHGLDITWQIPVGTRAEALDEVVLRRLRETGCRNITYAPESGSQRMLDIFDKKVDLEHILTSLRAAHALKLKTHINIIIGHPDERWAKPGDAGRDAGEPGRQLVIGRDARGREPGAGDLDPCRVILEERVVGARGWGGVAPPPNVTWLEGVTDAELAALYRGARCLVYASLYEGFGIPVAEALACGCAVVTSRGSAMEEIAGADATYVDPVDIESIRAGIAAASAPAPRRIGSWADVADRTRAVYEEVA